MTISGVADNYAGFGQAPYVSTLTAAGVLTFTQSGTWLNGGSQEGWSQATYQIDLNTLQSTKRATVTYTSYYASGCVATGVRTINETTPFTMTLSPTSAPIKILDPISKDPAKHVVKIDGFIDQGRYTTVALERRSGAVTDGLSLLLIKLPSSVDVTFSLDPTGADGVVLPITASVSAPATPSVPLVVSPVNGYAWVLYRAPADFGVNTTAPARTAAITFTVQGQAAQTLNLTLERPPVLLVHGQWDSPSVWTTDGFERSLNDSGFRTFLANYSEFNARSWDPDVRPNGGVLTVQADIDATLTLTRNRSLAATQVDVVAHSMGGLIARALTQQPNCQSATAGQCYDDRANLYQGSIRRLITIGTPHRGSPVANVYFSHRYDLIGTPELILPLGTWLALTGRPLGLGSVESMSPGSNAYRHLASTCSSTAHVLGHGLAGDHNPGAQFLPGLTDAFMLGLTGQTLDATFSGEPHDMLVGLGSQWGRGDYMTVPAESHFFSTVHSNSYLAPINVGVQSEPGNSAIQGRVAALLDSNGAELSCFPKSPWHGLPSMAPTSPIIPQIPSAIETDKSIHFTAPTFGAVLTQGTGIRLTLTVEPVGGAVPQSLVFVLGSTITVPGPSVAPFTLTIDLPAALPLGSLNIAAFANDAAGGLLADMITVTIAPSAAPLALDVSPQPLFFASASQTPQQLRVLGTFLRGVQSIMRYDVSAAALGTTYTTTHGDIVVHVSTDGVVSRVGPGEDTIQAHNAGLVATVPVTVECRYTLTGPAGSLPPLGGSTSVHIAPDAPSCGWNATSDSGWMTIVGAGAGTGAGDLSLTIAPNSNGGSRIGTLNVAGQTVSVIQAGQAAPAPFTDTPLIAGSTTVRAIHIGELRMRIDAQRLRYGLSIFDWTDPTLSSGATAIRVQHIVDLRMALAEVYNGAFVAPPTYAEPALESGMTIRATHIAELRAAVMAIE